MDDISALLKEAKPLYFARKRRNNRIKAFAGALLKEAKPLYFARKRRNNRIKAFAGVFALVLMFGGLYPRDYVYTEYNFGDLGREIYLTETGSVIEELGLPTDEFGLLMVG